MSYLLTVLTLSVYYVIVKMYIEAPLPPPPPPSIKIVSKTIIYM